MDDYKKSYLFQMGHLKLYIPNKSFEYNAFPKVNLLFLPHGMH